MEFTTTTQPAAAARPRTLSPSALTADWYTRPVSTDMRDQSAVVSLTAYHNSITRTAPNAIPAGVPTAPAGGFGAAKQAAPPRGVPR